jgi:alpha-tubulin suppressor-like RCC1 family protein
LALKRDGTLWHWGREIGLDLEKVLENVVAAAADQTGSVALLKDGSLWQWDRGEQPQAHFRCP